MTRLLKDMKTGESGIITAFHDVDPAYRRKLLAMGLTRGTRVDLVKVAPLGDPLELELRGYRLSLRRHEAAMIELALEENA